MRHELTVGRGVDQSRAGRFLPRQVRRLGKELIRFHNGELSQATEVGLRCKHLEDIFEAGDWFPASRSYLLYIATAFGELEARAAAAHLCEDDN